MKSRTYLWLAICLPVFLFVTSQVVRGEDVVSKISNRTLSTHDSPYAYSFLVAGHVYGTPSASLYPSASFLNSIGTFGDMNLEFVMLLGDVIQHQGAGDGIGELEIQIFRKTVADVLDVPIFNSPGNHDLENRELYERYFGETFFHFQNSSELFIVLDTELVSGQIDGLQLEYVHQLLGSVSKDSRIKNIFLFLHKTLWAVNNSPLNSIDPWVNGPRRGEVNQFEEMLLPELVSISERKDVYILSGDIGIKDYKLGKFPQESFSLFYYQEPSSNITYVACGLAENENDAVIKIDITEDGQVSLSAISLIGKDLGEIGQYGIDYWSDRFAESETNGEPRDKSTTLYQNIFSRVKAVVKNKHFMLGNIFSLILVFCGIMGFRFLRG